MLLFILIRLRRTSGGRSIPRSLLRDMGPGLALGSIPVISSRQVLVFKSESSDHKYIYNFARPLYFNPPEADERRKVNSPQLAAEHGSRACPGVHTCDLNKSFFVSRLLTNLSFN